jgi:hypothetical protein
MPFSVKSRPNFNGYELGSVTLKRIGFFVFQLNTQHLRIWADAKNDLSLKRANV